MYSIKDILIYQVPKSIRMKLVSGGFQSLEEADVVATFKLKGKKYKSAPVGFFVFNPESSFVYMGFDANSDGIIAADNKEAVAKFALPFDPFADDGFVVVPAIIASRFSNADEKAKLKFKSTKVGSYNYVDDALLFGEKLSSPLKMINGSEVDSFEFPEFVDTLISGGINVAEEDDEAGTYIFSTKSAAKAAAKDLGCKGAHKMGDDWMICRDMDEFIALQIDYIDTSI